MKKLENECGVKMLIMTPTIRVVSKSSLTSLTAEFKITMVPSDSVPDYQEFHNWIRANVDNQKISLEEAACKLEKIIHETWEPKMLKIEASTPNTGIHFPVTITIGSCDSVPKKLGKQKEEGEKEPA